MAIGLTEEQQTQYLGMVKEAAAKGDNANEAARSIIAFFKEKYSVELSEYKIAQQIYYYRKRKDLLLKKSASAKRKYTRRGARKDIGGGTVDPASEILRILRQTMGGYDAMFKFLRGELLRSRGQVYQMLKGAKIAPETEEAMIEQEVKEL